MLEPIHLAWELTLNTRSMRAAWAVFADTDRFNRAAGLGFSFSEEMDDQGRIVRIGQVKRLGMLLQWVDEPFEFVRPEWFRSVRRFRNGPLAKLTTTVHLRRSTKGIHLTYEVDLESAHWVARPVVLLDAKGSIEPMLDKTLRAAASQFDDAPEEYAPTPPLPEDADLSPLDDLTIGGRLADFLRHGDLRDQDRIRPLLLAKKWHIDEDFVIGEVLAAVRAGVLEPRFDLLCPSCLGAMNRMKTLDLRPRDLHCNSCNIGYDGSFPDSIEVTFRPTDRVRPIEVPTDCVHSPVRTRHVVARSLVRTGAEVTWRGTLRAGAYRLHVEPFIGGEASLEVRPGLRAHAVAIDLTEEGVQPAILRLGPGPVEIAVRSRLPLDVRVQLEKRWRPPHVLTVGRLLEREGVEDLFPKGILPRRLERTTRRAAVLVVDGRADKAALEFVGRKLTPRDPDETYDIEAAHDTHPLLCHQADGCWIGLFDHAHAALEAAQVLLPSPHLALAVDIGTISLVPRGTGQLPGGRIIDRVIRAARQMGVGRLGLAPEALADTELATAIERTGLPLVQAEGGELVWLRTPTTPPRPGLSAPSRVGGRYTLGPELARGGMGVVHEATDEKTGQDVVVKLLLPEFSMVPEHVQRFYWEARIAARIDHPHTVRVFDYGVTNGIVWLVMERLLGRELLDALTETGTLPVEQAVRIAIAVLHGLHAAHTRGVVHRDVKPSNVFLCTDPEPGHPKVLDFGIAITAEDDLEEDPNVVLGTPRYMAPEQVGRAALDGRADLYAVGLVLYEMLSGDVPFKAPDVRSLAFQRLTKDPAPLSQVAPEVPDAIAQVVMRALRVAPEDRFTDARQMAEALRDALGPANG